MSYPTTARVDTGYDSNDRAYENSAETGVVQGAELEEDEAISQETTTNPGGLTRTESGIHTSLLSDNTTGNNSMSSSAIGGFGIGSTNSNSTLP